MPEKYIKQKFKYRTQSIDKYSTFFKSKGIPRLTVLK